ncbi:hypothetical protein [Anaerobium acetethylicum]|uniref:DUF7973 domain-containing protein n=1 Tax=Anaerobium acetethylicum TaxID=1619234 RepID=A0A1D3TW14_9FIRM|nr:hypothetical protein [Anaerobium acetethylicum]SCP98402.1 hypothetical protein SAMN05421730_102019 [Anaerobium acetethylicum]
MLDILIIIFIAFCAGAFGTALGALGAVIMTAMAGLVGIIGNICGADFNFVSSVAFGLILGPQVSFGPACCAAGYAKRKGYLNSSKDIVTPLISLRKPDVLIVGGLFAVAGYFVNMGIGKMLPGKIDSIALTVVLISLAAKVMYGTDGLLSIIGRTPEEVKKAGGRYSIHNQMVWIRYQTTGLENVLIGVFAGGMSSYLTYIMLQTAEKTGNAGIAGVAILPGWAIAIICFFLNVSGLAIPVFHHICLVASYATFASFYGSAGGASCLLWGVAFGILAAYAGDLLAKTFTCFGEGFVDPPSMAIATCSILPLWIIPSVDGFNPDNTSYWVIPIVLIAFLSVVAFYQESAIKRRVNMKNVSEETNY